MSSVFASRLQKANPKVIWPILTRLPVVAKLGIAGVTGGSLGVGVASKTLDAFNVAENESSTKNHRKCSSTAAASAATATAATALARGLGLVAFAAEKQRGSSGDNAVNNDVNFKRDVNYDVNIKRDVIVNVDVIRRNNFNDNNLVDDVDGGGKSIGKKKPVYKYFTNLNEKNIEKPEQRNNNSNSEEADDKNNSSANSGAVNNDNSTVNNNSINSGVIRNGNGNSEIVNNDNSTVNNDNSINSTVNNNSINSLDEILALDANFLVATSASSREKAEATAKANCGPGCGMEDALERQPFMASPMQVLGPEVDGLDRSMEDLVVDNSSLNASDDDDDDDVPHEENFDNSKANPFNKSIEVLVDEALRWHRKLMTEPTGHCQPYDQIPEESFNSWVKDADKMFRERQFETLKEKFEEEYRKVKGRFAKRDPQLCWRMARLTFLMGNEVENNTIIFWKDAMIYAIEGIKNFEDEARLKRVDDVKQINHNCCWKCHLWFGIIMAKLGGLLQKDQKKRIMVAFMAREHLERAIQINPLDPIPHFALAKWHSEFCKLNAGQNKIVRELGHDLPVTDLRTAVRYAERANELSPKLVGSRVGRFPRNVYLLAELYYNMGQKEKSRYLVHALLYQLGPFVKSIEDRRAVERAKLLLNKLNNPTPNNPNDSTPRSGKARPQVPIYPDHHNNLFPPTKAD